MTSIFIYADDDAPARCQNCAWTGTAGDCEKIDEFQERVSAGERCPCGQCPECGALCQLLPAPEPQGNVTLSLSREQMCNVALALLARRDELRELVASGQMKEPDAAWRLDLTTAAHVNVTDALKAAL